MANQNAFQVLRNMWTEVAHIIDSTKTIEGYHQAPYAKFMLLSPFLEFLGCLKDDRPFDHRIGGRFHAGVERFLNQGNNKYDPKQLETNYRNGFLHKFSPQGKYDFVTRRDIEEKPAYNAIMRHLSEYDIYPGERHVLFILEEFYSDLSIAVELALSKEHEIITKAKLSVNFDSKKLYELEHSLLRTP